MTNQREPVQPGDKEALNNCLVCHKVCVFHTVRASGAVWHRCDSCGYEWESKIDLMKITPGKDGVDVVRELEAVE